MMQPPEHPLPDPDPGRYAGYPDYPGVAGYGTPGYGYPAPARAGRPGTVIAAAVLAFVVAALLIITAFVLFAFLSDSVVQVPVESDPGGSGSGGVDAEGVVAVIVNLATAGLLIAGGVVTLIRGRSGRPLLTAGASVCCAAGAYWVARSHQAAVLPWMLLFVAPTVLALVLVWKRRVSVWLSGPR